MTHQHYHTILADIGSQPGTWTGDTTMKPQDFIPSDPEPSFLRTLDSRTKPIDTMLDDVLGPAIAPGFGQVGVTGPMDAPDPAEFRDRFDGRDVNDQEGWR